jgi:two-component system chemotaxis sensor kinase CheA
MSDLAERTRQASLERVREVRRVLTVGRRPDAAAIDAALRELHAIKGETAMVGLKTLSQLSHALESLLVSRRAQPSPELGDALDALRVLSEVLAQSSAAELANSSDLEDLIFEVQAAVESTSAPSPAAAGPAVPAARAEAEPAASAAAEPAARPDEPEGAPVRSDKNWARVDARSVDELSESISELAAELDLVRAEVARQISAQETTGKQADARQRARAWRSVGESLAGLRGRVSQAEERAFSLRLVAVMPLFQELGDHVEGLARGLGKPVRVQLEAQGVSLERSVVDALREPLLHLVRNAIDHGIEEPSARGGKDSVGTICLSTETMGSETVVVVEDDGAGIDVQKLRRRAVETELLSAEQAARLSHEETLDLIFKDGFSQRRKVTELSGRGVGLGAVRRSIENLGGAVRVLGSPNGGTRFELVLPSSMAREKVLLVQAAGMYWGIPSRWVRFVVRDSQMLAAAQKEGFLRSQEGLAVARPLTNWLGARRETDGAAVVVEIAHRRVALLVSDALREVEILRRPSEPVLASAARLAGSGVLGDGGTVFFLRWAEVLREVSQIHDGSSPVEEQRHTQRPRVLVADDSPVIRDIVGDVLCGAGLEVTLAADGRAALELSLAHDFDLVVSDVEMPHMNGLELLQKLRQRSQLLPVVMLTTRSTPEHRREAALLGANAYIAKSEFHGDTLLEVVRRFVRVQA